MEQGLEIHHKKWSVIIMTMSRKKRMNVNMTDLPPMKKNENNQIEFGEFLRNSVAILIFGLIISIVAFLFERVK